MASQWYVEDNGQRQGPYSSADLKQLADGRKITPAHRIWRDGLPAWVEARSVNGLFSASPPAIPASAPQLPQAAAEVVCPHCQGKGMVPLAVAQQAAQESSPSYGKSHVITEQTAKRYKLIIAAGGATAVIGIVIAVLGLGSAWSANGQFRPGAVLVFGAVLLIGGLVAYGTGRGLAWWHHG